MFPVSFTNMEDTIFTKIVKGEIPCYKIAEDERFFAFLDISPLAPGHTLVITKAQNDYIFDLDDDTLAAMMLFAKKVAKGIKKAIPCLRVGVAVIGLEVPHNHIHLVPLNKEGDLDFKAPRAKLTEEEFAEIAAKISAAI
jgi:histidine triad (HIT) family protein